MKIYKIAINKKDLAHVPEQEKIFFFQIGIMLNEINMLHKITYFSKKEGVSEIEEKAQTTQSLFFHSLLIGKLWECWKSLQKTFFKCGLSKQYEQLLNNKGKESLNNLKNYFGKNEWISDIRNKFSFHYDPAEISKQLNRMPNDELLEIYLAKSQGNSLYYMSSQVHLMGILATISDSDDRLALNRYFSETLEVANSFLQFFNHCLVALVDKHLELELKEIEFPDPPKVKDLYIPYFISR